MPVSPATEDWPFRVHYKHGWHHEEFDNVTPTDVFFLHQLQMLAYGER